MHLPLRRCGGAREIDDASVILVSPLDCRFSLLSRGIAFLRRDCRRATGARSSAGRLRVSSPVGLVNARDGSNRLFIVEQGGTIKIYDGSQVPATPFLNLTSRVLVGRGERGLLGLAFDPNYVSNGLFYVYYTSQPNGEVTIARYSVTADPNVGNPNSEVILKTQVHATFANHNGGSLLFGPDGCLYAGIGDGGSGGDPNNNGQNLNTLLGKIIRISASDGAACAAAPGNPFAGTARRPRRNLGAGAAQSLAHHLRPPDRRPADRRCRPGHPRGG